jgi:hypothetical protein
MHLQQSLRQTALDIIDPYRLRQDISALNTSQLKRLVDQLRSELREAEAELWRRTAVCLAPLPLQWADPPMSILSAVAREDYYEDMHSDLGRRLPPSCRLVKGSAQTEVWGPAGALGKNPTRRLRELVAQVRDELEAREDGPEPWC